MFAFSLVFDEGFNSASEGGKPCMSVQVFFKILEEFLNVPLTCCLDFLSVHS